MTRLSCSGPMLLRAAASAVGNLERHVEEINALNVFPVPDGDTGSNMLATMRSALAAAEALPPGRRSLAAVAEALSRGALTGARGNSGVILSQIIRGMTTAASGRPRAQGPDLSEALRHAARAAWDTVSEPVEGTILTVIRDAAEAAEAAAARDRHVETVLSEAVEAAALSVARTPELLPVLRDAGVVDSGGQGLYRLLQGTLLLEDALGAAMAGAGIRLPELVEEAAFGYETMYLLEADAVDLDPAAIRADIEELGGSVLVAGDARAVRIHVHGERPDLVIGYGLARGRLSGISVENLDRQVEAARERRSSAHPGRPDGCEPHSAAFESMGPPPGTPAMRQLPGAGAPLAPGVADAPRAPSPGAAVAGAPPTPGVADAPRAPSPGPELAVVAVATGDGLADLMLDAGATAVVRPAHGMRPSSGEIVAQILAIGSPEVIVLPNDRDSRMAAQQASAMLPRVNVSVVPTRDPAEGIAALLAFDPRRSAAQNVEGMAGAARAIHSFSLSVAVRDAILDGRPVRRGEALAISPAGEMLASGPDLEAALLEALAGLGEGFELVTVYRGRAIDEQATERVSIAVPERFPGVTVEILSGGQPQDLFVAVE